MDQRLFLTENDAGYCKHCDAQLVWAVTHKPGDMRQKFAHAPKPHTGSWAPPVIQFNSDGELAWYYVQTAMKNAYKNHPRGWPYWEDRLPEQAQTLHDLPSAYPIMWDIADHSVTVANAIFGGSVLGFKNRAMVRELHEWIYPTEGGVQ